MILQELVSTADLKASKNLLWTQLDLLNGGSSLTNAGVVRKLGQEFLVDDPFCYRVLVWVALSLMDRFQSRPHVILRVCVRSEA